jgi:hypothetical protein
MSKEAGGGVCAVTLLWCGVVLLLHWAAGAFACGWDTSYCAQGRAKDGVYRGVLVDAGDRTLANTAFAVTFASRLTAPAVRGFTTDARGAYCVVWAEERIVPFITAGSSPTLPTDVPWEPLRGAAPPAGCQSGDRGIPWNRSDDLQRTPQYISVFAVVLPGVALLLLGLVRGTRRARHGGLGLAFAGTLLAAALWLG